MCWNRIINSMIGMECNPPIEIKRVNIRLCINHLFRNVFSDISIDIVPMLSLFYIIGVSISNVTNVDLQQLLHVYNDFYFIKCSLKKNESQKFKNFIFTERVFFDFSHYDRLLLTTKKRILTMYMIKQINYR